MSLYLHVFNLSTELRHDGSLRILHTNGYKKWLFGFNN